MAATDTPGLFGGLKRICRRFIREQRGNVLMLVGLSIVPLTFATGMSIDYTQAMRLQTKVNSIADAASLASATTPMLNQTLAQACVVALRTFVSQTTGLPGLTLNTSDPTQFNIVITETYPSQANVTANCASLTTAIAGSIVLPTSRKTTVTYRGKSANSFAGVLGVNTLTISGTSTAQVGLATYYQIVFVVDVSNSMAIGGTASDIAKLAADKTIMDKNNIPGCQFACHDPNGTVPVQASTYCNSNPSDYFCHANGPTYCPFGNGGCGTNLTSSPTYDDRRALAKLYGYKLKIDYVNSAVTSFMNSLQSPMQKAPNNYSLSIYTFGTAFTQLQAPTTDWATAQAAAGKIDLEVAKVSPSTYFGGGGNQGWTFMTSGLSNTLQNLTNVGNGTSPTARKTYVIFMSDGVEDDYGQIVNGRGTYYNYAAQCQAIKNAGITMFSIETAYPVISPDDAAHQYTLLVANLPSRNNNVQIADVMQGCASSSANYFQATDGPGIQSAVSSVFAAINAQASHITQ